MRWNRLLSDFYPRSPCGERLCTAQQAERIETISIHALLAESDRQSQRQTDSRPAFLSTLSLRRATYSHIHYRHSSANFYPRSPCGERLLSVRASVVLCRIFLSTLSLRRATGHIAPSYLSAPKFLSTLSLRRATFNDVRYTLHEIIFLSTLSLRRATLDDGGLKLIKFISIHALLAESDFCTTENGYVCF